MTIYMIKKRLGNSTHYFDRDTMHFFNQTLKDFRVKQISDDKYLFYAPSYWDGKLMRISQQIYNADTNMLCDVPDSLKVNSI